MAYFLLGLSTLNIVLFSIVGVQSWRLGRKIPTPRARTQAYLLTLVSAGFVVAAAQRVGLQLVELGVLGDSFRDDLVGPVQLVTGLAALVLIVPALWMLRQLTAVFAKSDRFVSVLTDRVRLDGSVSEAGLTARELNVLEHLAQGILSDADLAEVLYISPATAATHVRNIMKKTGINRRHELMLLAPDRLKDTG